MLFAVFALIGLVAASSQTKGRYKYVEMLKYDHSSGPPATRDAESIPSWLHHNLACPSGTFSKSNKYCYSDADCGNTKCTKDFGPFRFLKGESKEQASAEELAYLEYKKKPEAEKIGLCCVSKPTQFVVKTCEVGHRPIKGKDGGDMICGVEYGYCPSNSSCHYSKAGTFGKCCYTDIVIETTPTGGKVVSLIEDPSELKSVKTGRSNKIQFPNFNNFGQFSHTQGSEFSRGQQSSVQTAFGRAQQSSFERGSQFSHTQASRFG